MSETDYFLKKSKKWRCGIVVLLPLLLTGCFYSVHNFGDDRNTLNTTIYWELKKANQNNTCFDPFYLGKYAKEFLDNEERNRVGERMNKIFQQFFPIGTPLQQVTEKMQSEGGAICSTQVDTINNNITHTFCTYKHEYVQGMKEFGITGWKILSAQWQKDNFEFGIIAQEGRLTNVEGKVINGECYEIDKDVYEKSKTIKLIKKLHF
jgi:hypothetical protein